MCVELDMIRPAMLDSGVPGSSFSAQKRVGALLQLIWYYVVYDYTML